jgi:hypothetical protein
MLELDAVTLHATFEQVEDEGDGIATPAERRDEQVVLVEGEQLAGVGLAGGGERGQTQ